MVAVRTLKVRRPVRNARSDAIDGEVSLGQSVEPGRPDDAPDELQIAGGADDRKAEPGDVDLELHPDQRRRA
jgi:hypothetical protein